MAYATATAAVWIVYDYSQQYFTLASVLVGAVLMIGMMGVIAVLLAEAHEWAEAQWVIERRRVLAPRATERARARKVSIHVPAYNEPPQMLVETLDALARLDYPDYEVLVIDNNTRDEAAWRPVEAHCRALGERFRFFHVAPLAGFKAGALNFALARTAPDAQIVAVIDSDYVVDPNWLHDLVPAFDNPNAWRSCRRRRTIVMSGATRAQRLQSDVPRRIPRLLLHRHDHAQRAQRDHPARHDDHGPARGARRGRRLVAVVHHRGCGARPARVRGGYEASYTARSYGRGLMPDTFIDFKKQRYRWAYGAMQILKSHARTLSSRRAGLSAGQRYHFIAGWLPWIADGFNLVFNLAALGWSVAMVFGPGAASIPRCSCSACCRSRCSRSSWSSSCTCIASAWAPICARRSPRHWPGLPLAHTIALATVSGLFTRNEPFFRTPKQGGRQPLARALGDARQELLLMLALWSSALALSRIPLMDSPDLTVWRMALWIQSVPYAATVAVSVISTLQLPARLIGVAGQNDRETPAQAAAGSFKPVYRAPREDI